MKCYLTVLKLGNSKVKLLHESFPCKHPTDRLGKAKSVDAAVTTACGTAGIHRHITLEESDNNDLPQTSLVSSYVNIL